jgi:hypothetical protein
MSPMVLIFSMFESGDTIHRTMWSTADPLDHPFGELAIRVLFDQSLVGLDDLELDGRRTAIQNQYVHLLLRDPRRRRETPRA